MLTYIHKIEAEAAFDVSSKQNKLHFIFNICVNMITDFANTIDKVI